MSHPFLLVLQFRESGGLDREAIADELGRLFGRCGDDQGNPQCYSSSNWGGGTAEFFVYTHDPSISFERLRPLLRTAGWSELLVVAWSPTDGERFAVLWPEGYEAPWSLPEADEEEAGDLLELPEELASHDEDENEAETERFDFGGAAGPIEPS